MKNTFSNRHTNIIKGCAVILLLFHHLFYKREYFDECFTFCQSEMFLYNLIAIMSKVCVAIFLLLSGYGLTASANNMKETITLRFSFKHIFKVMFNFWFIYVIFVPLGLFFGRIPANVYGTGITGITNFLYDFLGIAYLTGTPTFNATWWFMGEILRLYILFPILYYGVKNNLLLISLIGIFLGVFNNFIWFMPFICGMIIAEKNLFSRYMDLSNIKKFLIILVGIASVPLRIKFGEMSDAVFALWISLFILSFVKPENILGKILELLGKHSGNIFMLHTFIYYYYFRSFIYSFYHPVIIFLVLLILCLGTSWVLEQLKKISLYNRLGDSVQECIKNKRSYQE